MDTTAQQTRKLPRRNANVRARRQAHSRATCETTTNLKPSSRYVAKDLFDGGSVLLLPSTLLTHGHPGHGEAMTVRGRAVTVSVQQKRNEDQRVVHPGDRSLSAISGLDGTQGSLAPRGAVVKVAGMADLKFAEPARFDGEEARFRTVKNKNYREGEVLVIRSERLQRGLGMREALSTGDTVALLFCKRFSTTTCESAAGAIGQDATAGACHALV